ncbi:hypothetical protein NW762_006689 [Fusarium torreyae]|uniref:Uncharacterized protein n=1 Tax=Fusarium torreyae TaxID=1237075 RepID=A0A9W8S2X0_9HYPO|nr:hypothetical protein NW762_006689 [Fusarium torreyae]
MTREMAMRQAGDLEQKLGHRDCDQASLLPGMTQWLSSPVIKVLSEDMKNRVFMWCQQYSQGWLDEIRAAQDDLLEYRYTTSVEEPSSLTYTANALQKEISDKLDAFKSELMKAQQDNLSAALAQMQCLQVHDQTSSTESSNKRRRTNTQGSPSDEIQEKLLKVDEALCLLVHERSEVLKHFRIIATNIDPNFTQKRSNSDKNHYTGRRLKELRDHQSRSLGLSTAELKMLRGILASSEEDNPMLDGLGYFFQELLPQDQYNELEREAVLPGYGEV